MFKGDLDALIRRLVELLNDQDDGVSDKKGNANNIAMYSAGILANLTCNKQMVKERVFEANGVPALMNAIAMWGNEKALIEPAIDTLKHLTCGNSKAQLAQEQLIKFHNFRGLRLIMDMLEQHMRPRGQQAEPYWPTIKAILGLFKNLAFVPTNQDVLREQGCLHMNIELFKFLADKIPPPVTFYKSVQHTFIKCIISFQTKVEKTNRLRVEDIVDISLGFITIAVRYAPEHSIFLDHNLIMSLGKLCFGGYDNEAFQRTALGALNEMSSASLELVAGLIHVGLATPLQELVNKRPNEKTGNYRKSTIICEHHNHTIDIVIIIYISVPPSPLIKIRRSRT